MNRTAFHRQVAHQEEMHEKRAHEYSKLAIEQYEIAYSLCDEILYDIEENINMEGDHDRQAIFVILVRTLGSLQSIKWLFLKGYYYDGTVLYRSFMEAIGTCCFISQNKGTGEKWLLNKKLATSLDMFKAAEKTLKRNMPDKEIARFYGKLSMFAHCDNWAIGTTISEIEDEYSITDDFNTIRFRNPTPYDKLMVDTIVYHPLMALVIIQALFPEISDYDKKQIAEISFIIKPETTKL
jgi:hypothetical protein